MRVNISLVANSHETFFTVVGCMDGRFQVPAVQFGKDTFQAQFPDTITEAGTAGILVNSPETIEDAFKSKLEISLDIHKSKGIVVGGNAECVPFQMISKKRIY